MIITLLPAAAQDAPQARITLPIRGQTLRGSISVQGSASAPQFTQYQVAYAPEPDLSNWTIINGALQPVPNGTLAEWNTRPLPDGKYALRLQVFSTDGGVSETLVRDITLANAVATGTPGAESNAVISDTGQTLGASDSTSPSSATADQSIDLADVPQAFLKGVRYTLYAFVALGAYVLLKKLAGAAVRRLIRKPTDYGH